MGKNSVAGCAVLFLLTITSYAQENRYMVFFRDKIGTPYSVDAPEQFLSPLALQRRIKSSVTISADDFPVNPAYIAQVKGAGASVFFQTRWMNGVLVQCNSDIINSITALDPVERVELVAPGSRLASGGRVKVTERKKGTRTNEVSDLQLEMLGLDQMHRDNFKGEGVIVAILDSGFEGVDQAGAFSHIFDENRVDLAVSKDFVFNSTNVFQHDDHGTEVFSVIAAFQPGTFTGGAYKATYQLYVTEDVPTEYRVEEYNWLFAAERADSAGADVIQSSLGYYDFDLNSMDYQKTQMDGETAVISKAAQMAADRGIVVVTSAGNEGNISWQIITAPADAEGVLAVASVNADLERASTSSIGPSADLRVKPDVAALGVATSVIGKNGLPGKSSGTSLAAPLVTSLVAGTIQRYPMLSSSEVMEAIRMSGNQTFTPDNYLGYGVPKYQGVVNYLDEVIQQNDFEVYPNPFSGSGPDSLVIRPKDVTNTNGCTVELLSSDGRSMLYATPRFTWSSRTFEPAVGHLSAGIYFLRISNNGKRYTFKLVKH